MTRCLAQTVALHRSELSAGALCLDQAQAMPGGAGTSLLRDVFYFPEASTGGSIAVLAAYVGVGLVVVIASSLVRRRAQGAIPARGSGNSVAALSA